MALDMGGIFGRKWLLGRSAREGSPLLFYGNQLIPGVVSGGVKNVPETTANDATVGTLDWTNPSNVRVRDHTYATAVDAGDTAWVTKYLKATAFNFVIPDGATINGILVEVRKKSTGPPIKDRIFDNAARIVKGGTIGDVDKSGAMWPAGTITPDRTDIYGSAGERWGLKWKASDINSSGFGFAISAKRSDDGEGSPTASIDSIKITVFYNP